MNITRQQQLLSHIKRIISTELRELNHELFHTVVVTHVHLNNSGEFCSVFVEASDQAIKELNTTYRNEIQRIFMKQYLRRKVPKLSFHRDQGEDTRLEEILAEDHDETTTL